MNAYLLFSASCLQFRTSTVKAKREFSSEGTHLHSFRSDSDGFFANAVWTGDSTAINLLFVHGSPGSWTAFEDYLRDSVLLTRFRLIAADRMGFGYNHFGHPEASLEKQAQNLLQVMDSLDNGRPFYIIGHSLGGPVAVQMAAMDTLRIKGLCLLSASIDPDLEPREAIRPLILPKAMKYLIPTSIWTSNYEIYYLMDELKKQKVLWSSIQAKMLVMHGEKDKMVPLGNADYAESNYPDKEKFRKVILEGKNHFIPWTAMDTVRSELIIFAGDEQ